MLLAMTGLDGLAAGFGELPQPQSQRIPAQDRALDPHRKLAHAFQRDAVAEQSFVWLGALQHHAAKGVHNVVDLGNPAGPRLLPS